MRDPYDRRSTIPILLCGKGSLRSDVPHQGAQRFFAPVRTSQQTCRQVHENSDVETLHRNVSKLSPTIISRPIPRR